jgi:hypothetical protein
MLLFACHCPQTKCCLRDQIVLLLPQHLAPRSKIQQTGSPHNVSVSPLPSPRYVPGACQAAQPKSISQPWHKFQP